MKWRLAFLFFVQHGRDFEIVCSSFEASESLLKVAYQELFIDKKKKTINRDKFLNDLKIQDKSSNSKAVQRQVCRCFFSAHYVNYIDSM